MRPPFAYYGGKVGLSQLIVSLLPAHRVYMEPFFGSGAVLFAKRPAQHEIANDLDGNVVTFFRVLRDRPEDLERACTLTPYAREEFSAAALDEDLDDLERARRWWVRVNQSFAKSAGRATGWSVTTARTQSTARSVMGRIERFHAVAERLRTVCFEQCDAADLVDRLATPDTLIYADPPYMATTRNGRARDGVAADYGIDMGDEAAHRRLAASLLSTPAAVILSGYPSPIYDELYAGWDRVDVARHLHSSNALTVDRGTRTEVLWSNRPLTAPAQLELAPAERP